MAHLKFNTKRFVQIHRVSESSLVQVFIIIATCYNNKYFQPQFWRLASQILNHFIRASSRCSYTGVFHISGSLLESSMSQFETRRTENLQSGKFVKYFQNS